jgi:hypothetical protein
MSYAQDINLMPRPNVRPVKRDVEPILTLIPKKQHGRPRNVRRRGLNESVKFTCKEYDVSCEKCGQKDNNAMSYCLPDNSNMKKRAKGVRKPNSNNENAVSFLFFIFFILFYEILHLFYMAIIIIL